MNAIIDLGSELLVDRSQIRLPHLRLLADALGSPIVKGSAWLVLDKLVLRSDPSLRSLQLLARSAVVAA